MRYRNSPQFLRLHSLIDLREGSNVDPNANLRLADDPDKWMEAVFLHPRNRAQIPFEFVEVRHFPMSPRLRTAPAGMSRTPAAPMTWLRNSGANPLPGRRIPTLFELNVSPFAILANATRLRRASFRISNSGAVGRTTALPSITVA